MTKELSDITEEELYEAAQKCSNVKEVAKYLKLKSKTNVILRELKSKIMALGCDLEHWENRGIKESRVYSSLDDKITEQSWYINTTQLKKDLIKDGVLIEKCVECGIGPWWNYKKLELQLDHINGNNRDNRIENLRLLCPNCHSQTSTYAGKNRK